MASSRDISAIRSGITLFYTLPGEGRYRSFAVFYDHDSDSYVLRFRTSIIYATIKAFVNEGELEGAMESIAPLSDWQVA